MLYILPPPSAPSPPSPWTTILCGGGGSGPNSNFRGGSSPPSNPLTQGGIWTARASIKKPPVKLRRHMLRQQGTFKESGAGASGDDEDQQGRNSRSLSECYFAGKGAALVLPPNERLRPSRRVSASGSDIQQHLQSMFYLLRPEETLKMAVKLESVHSGRTRYLVVVSCIGRQDAEESCLLGIDCNEKTTVGLVLRVLADTSITLDGDGGFSVSVCGRQHIFKPVSVQAMWSALQTLHKVSFKAREQNYFQGGLTHDWVSYYEQRIESDRSCLNEWHAMDNLESRRPPSPDSVRSKPREREETERVIRSTLKEIMMSVDLDEVTSKYIRGRLEEYLDMDLGEFKPFIDQEMLTILGQMDAATEVFDHVYLGSEWNASNLEELQKNGVRHILNVTREIDNFFPGMFNYQNIRVYDDEKTDLLKHWDNTFKYITNAKKEGSKVLVHCKMGVSRSASVVIAYAMKAYNWDYQKAFKYVKHKRNCIKPNASFISQLETYQGILDAMKNREKLQRSKSENNLKSPGLATKVDQDSIGSAGETPAVGLHRESSEQQTLVSNWNLRISGQELGKHGGRPKSWSPDSSAANAFFTATSVSGPASVSLEQLNLEAGLSCRLTQTLAIINSPRKEDCKQQYSVTLPEPNVLETGLPAQHATDQEARNYRMPCGNGQAYSVSPNKVVHLPASCSQQKSDCSTPIVSSVKHRVNELESQSSQSVSALGRKVPLDRKGLVLNLTSQFELSNSKPSSPVELEGDCSQNTPMVEDEEEPVLSQTKIAPQMLTAVLVKKEIWDPGEKESPTTCAIEPLTVTSAVTSSNSLVWTSPTELSDCKDDGMVFISELKLTDSEAGEGELSQSLPSVKLGNSSNSRPVTRKEGDPFSAQLDKVFDREERRQQRPVPLLPACTVEAPTEVVTRECPSRQSSWSSYDSAVVLGYQGEARDAPSRQSSWGSGDTRWTYGGMLPSRNSSWGSYDMRPPVMQNVNELNEKDQQQLAMEDLFGSSSSGMFPYDKDEYPWYPGTVKRTKQKLEEVTNTVKRVCSDSPQRSNSASPPSNTGLSHPACRLSDSATGKNVKIHGPRPYQSPTSERLLSTSGFTFPSPVDHQLREEKNSGSVMIPFEAQNSALIHYASSPTLYSHQGIMSTSPTSDKMATSQPNITLLDPVDVAGDNSTQTCAISRETELSSLNLSSSSLSESACPLSVSAPTTSMSSMMDNVTLTSPSSSLPTVSLRCLNSMDIVVNESCDLVNKTASPSIVHTPQCASVKHQKKVLENLNNISKKNQVSGDSTETVTKDVLLSRFSDANTQKSISGLVKNLKKEFEAKSVLNSEKSVLGEVCVSDTDASEQKTKRSDSIKVRSFPSSPVSIHPECKSSGSLSPSNTTEDLSVKMLVGKYEVSKTTRPHSPSGGRPRFISESENVQRRVFPHQQSSIPHRKSSLDMPNVPNNAQSNKHSLHIHNLKNGSSLSDTKERPPVPGPTPSVVVASVMAKAASKKQQQGKTHPLTRLSINKPRHNNPVYNTM